MSLRNLFVFIVVLQSIVTFGQEINHEHSIHHSFIENKGQWNDQILFKSQFDGGNLWVQQHKLLFHLQDFSATQQNHANFSSVNEALRNRQTVVHLNFIGSNEIQQIEKSEATPNYYNYFKGNDPQKWASNVHGYGEAILSEIYNGIDLKLIEELEQLKYEFHVKPHVDASQIKLEYVGQNEVRINKNGDLIVSTSLGEIIEQKPYAYQIVNGNIREVSCDFELTDNMVSFNLGEYNPNVKLIIDPVLIFATYSGSVTDNFGMTATYGHDGTAYSGGLIYGNEYPTPDNNAFDISSNFTVPNNGQGTGYGVTDVFISRYSSDGSNMLWTSFVGGGNDTLGTETVHSLICDDENNIYFFGATSSLDFPIQGGYQSTHAGGTDLANFYQNGVYYKEAGTDLYVAKLSASGQTLMGSTYFGGSLNDGVNYKDNMPVNSLNGTYTNASQYDSLTYNYGDQFRGEIMLDKNGDCIIASCTKSVDFPTKSAFQASNAGMQDGVVFKLNGNLSSLEWSSYFGGSEKDACYSVKVDSSDNILFTGGTCSMDLPGTSTGWQTAYNGGEADGFVMKLDPTGTVLMNGSYIGTAEYDQAYFVEFDRANNVYLLGQSEGGTFPVLNAGFVSPNSSQFVMKLDSTLSNVTNSTTFGNGNSNPNISPSAFLVDICGNIYISGWGANLLQSSDSLVGMPVTSDAYLYEPPNGFDFYLLVIERDFTDTLYATYFGEPGYIREHVDGGTSRFDKDGVVYQSVCGACGGQTGGAVTTPNAWSLTDLSPNCNNLVFKFDFELIPNAAIDANDILGCAPFTVTFDNFSTDSDSYLWDFGNGDTTTVDKFPTVTYTEAGVFDVYLYVTDSICLLTDTAHLVITVTDSLEVTTTPDQVMCDPITVDLIAYTNGSANEFIWSSTSDFSDTLNMDLSDSVLSVSPIVPTDYYVRVSNDGCFLIDSVNITFVSTYLELNANDSICTDETTWITATNVNPAISFSNYIWSPDSVIVNPSSTTTVEVAPDVTQYIYITALSSTGCSVSDSILIHVGHIPSDLVVASADSYTVPVGGEISLHGSPSGYSYQWTPPFNLTTPTEQHTTGTTDKPLIYTLYVSDGVCTKSDTVYIKTFEYTCEDPYVYVPNAFTPNGDGENDVLYVRGYQVKEMVFRIFDRWGELVFESYERPFGWDGTFRGKELDPDVYDYYLKVTCLDDMESIIKGNVTLIR